MHLCKYYYMTICYSLYTTYWAELYDGPSFQWAELTGHRNKSQHIKLKMLKRSKEIVTTFCFVGDCGWVWHLDVVEENRGIAFLVFLYIEKGIFFHI